MLSFNKKEDIVEQKFSEVGILTLRKDDIITFEPKEGKLEHNVESMKVELDIFKDWAKEKKLFFISDNRTLKRFDNDVREYAQEHLPFFCKKFALLVSSGISSFLTNMFIYVNRPPVPTKTFTSPEEAIKWLKNGE